MIDFEHLYLLDITDLRGAFLARFREEIDKFALLRAEFRPTKPLVLEHVVGKSCKDVIGTGYAGLYLFSDRIIEVLKRERVTGWTTFPVEISGKDGQQVKGYQGFAVTGRCGPIDNTKSKKVWRPPPVPEGQRFQVWLGLYFDPKSWDGSDIFAPSPKGVGWAFAVERVKEALQRAKVTNVVFKRLTEIERLRL